MKIYKYENYNDYLEVQIDLKVVFKKPIPLKNKANMTLYRLKKK